MSYANGTAFYNLPQTVGTDKRDWFDTNQAFADIDAALHAAVEGQATDAEAIAVINSKLVDDEGDIASLQATTATHSSQIITLTNGVQENAVNIADVRNDVEDMITAYNEATATASRAYAIGDYFIYNNVLYKATTAIAIGDTIVPDTNCTTTNVTTQIKDLNSGLSEIDGKVSNQFKSILSSTSLYQNGDTFTIDDDTTFINILMRDNNYFVFDSELFPISAMQYISEIVLDVGSSSSYNMQATIYYNKNTNVMSLGTVYATGWVFGDVVIECI